MLPLPLFFASLISFISAGRTLLVFRQGLGFLISFVSFSFILFSHLTLIAFLFDFVHSDRD
jgi:hypothetical protein